MKLYLISQDKNTGYDTYDSAVVVCANEEEAKYCHPNEDYHWEKDAWAYQYLNGEFIKEGPFSDWAPPNYVKVQYLGEAISGFSKVVCASYNAG